MSQVKSIEWIIYNEIDTALSGQITSFYDQTHTPSAFQHPHFVNHVFNDKNLIVIGYQNKNIVATAAILLKKTFLGELLYGPVIDANLDYNHVQAQLISFLHKEGIKIIRQQEDISRNESASNNTSLSTLIIDTNPDIETLWQGLSAHHRRDTQKAIREGLHVERFKNEGEIDVFINGLTGLFKQRGLSFDRLKSTEYYRNTLKLIIKEPQWGEALIVLNADKVIVGGTLWINYGNRLVYDAGYSDKNTKQPVLYIALWEAILKAKALNIPIDLGGYALDAGEQLTAINKFKAGFGGNLIHYPNMKFYYANVFWNALHWLYKTLKIKIT